MQTPLSGRTVHPAWQSPDVDVIILLLQSGGSKSVFDASGVRTVDDNKWLNWSVCYVKVLFTSQNLQRINNQNNSQFNDFEDCNE